MTTRSLYSKDFEQEGMKAGPGQPLPVPVLWEGQIKPGNDKRRIYTRNGGAEYGEYAFGAAVVREGAEQPRVRPEGVR